MNPKESLTGIYWNSKLDGDCSCLPKFVGRNTLVSFKLWRYQFNSAPEKNRGFVEGRVYRHIVSIWSIQSWARQVLLNGWRQISCIFIQDYLNILESREMSCLNSPSTAFQRLTFFILFAPTLPTLRLPDCKRRQSGWGMTWHDIIWEYWSTAADRLMAIKRFTAFPLVRFEPPTWGCLLQMSFAFGNLEKKDQTCDITGTHRFAGGRKFRFWHFGEESEHRSLCWSGGHQHHRSLRINPLAA